MNMLNHVIFYWTVVTEKKRLNSVYAKVSYLRAGILSDKLAISLAIVIFKKLDLCH